MKSNYAKLGELAEKIRAVEQNYGIDQTSRNDFIDHPQCSTVPTEWHQIDSLLGSGLTTGLHEWFGVSYADENHRDTRSWWTPPLCILIHLAWQAVRANCLMPWTIWIGRRCHPYPHLLLREEGTDCRLLQNSLFIAPRDTAAKVWATDLCLRSPAVGIVIADGNNFDVAVTRRLQLLARSRDKWAFIARRPRERHQLSAAQSRWLVRSEVSTSAKALGVTPRWSIELLRYKGIRLKAESRIWFLEWNRGKGSINLSPALAGLGRESEMQRRPVPRQHIA